MDGCFLPPLRIDRVRTHLYAAAFDQSKLTPMQATTREQTSLSETQFHLICHQAVAALMIFSFLPLQIRPVSWFNFTVYDGFFVSHHMHKMHPIEGCG